MALEREIKALANTSKRSMEMRIKSLSGLGSFVLALLFFPAPTFAQGCYECNWMDECVDADWHGHGWTQCEVVGIECRVSGGICWGPDPDPQRAVIFVRADGTLLLPATGEASLTASTELGAAELAGPAVAARGYERNCKGLITRRAYSKAELAEIARRTKHLTI